MAAPIEKKRFIIPSQEAEITPVKPLFKSLGKSIGEDNLPQLKGQPTVASYADYLFGQNSKLQSKGQLSQPSSASVKYFSVLSNEANTSDRNKLVTSTEAQNVAAYKAKSLEYGDGRGVHTGLEDEDTKGVSDIVADGTGETIETAGTSGAALPKTVSKSGSIIVSPRQRGNPVLKFIRNVPWEFGEIIPDYLMGQSTCALFLSLRYHNLNPNYIHDRLKQLGQSYALKVLLVQVDVKDPHHALKELAKICILADCTLILAWSPEEAGRYLETYKSYENKPADALKERMESDFVSQMTDCLTTVKSVNKTDSATLLSTFGSLANIINASREDLSLCPGLGPQKARRLYDVLHEPFLKSK
ncbi:DNA excision repair protein ERCC-1 [Protopterus annectens]|uniref:DNA excision repair protein ERCC-1 n=1 Tax=Protopterus annectens TaxID=7888 RepID=UPI001CFAEFE1|nr:DNA excision repair protein ERCC-1 [Protopterus annectens]XP_043940273.1 DNA excision repair protein ERCC-1 [Protopterus annectens]XP_043940274.1 DNA excision repair protein ERCC-1 [Protopterus annectens]XP_043940275.1 DNA excision repair protein ERCC-1 [Protopterus annectens]